MNGEVKMGRRERKEKGKGEEKQEREKGVDSDVKNVEREETE